MSSSKPSIASLQTQVTDLQAQVAEIPVLKAQVAALMARLDALSPGAAPAEAPAKGKGKRAAKKEKKPKDPDAPKRAPTAFFAFNAAERAKSPGETLTATVLSERWKLLTKEQKDAYKPVASEAAASEAE
jgi:hypothetical protein